MIKADDWNQNARLIDSSKLLVGREQTMGGGGNLPFGRIADRARANPARHPFMVEPFWDPEMELTEREKTVTGRQKGAWCCRIVPGFLNGYAPALRVAQKFIPEGARVWGNQYGKTALDPESDKTVQVLLTDEFTPFMKLTSLVDSRAKVFGADGMISRGEVPLFFRAQGAMAPVKLDSSDFASNAANIGASPEIIFNFIAGNLPPPKPQDDDGFPEGNRLLMQCDIVLQTDRPTVKQEFFVDEVGITRLSGFTIELPPHSDYAARIYHIAKYIPPKAPTLLDILFGTYQEIPLDEIVLATVYFLSPVAYDNSSPDGSWMAFVRHEVFWNLNYCSIQNIDPFKIDNSFYFFKAIGTVLAGGAAALFLWVTADQKEADYDTVNTIMNQTAVHGQFWTAA